MELHLYQSTIGPFSESRASRCYSVPWLGASTLPLIGVVLPTLQTPLADGFMGDVDPKRSKTALAHRDNSRGSGSRARPHG